jgi:hypothetical protein
VHSSGDYAHAAHHHGLAAHTHQLAVHHHVISQVFTFEAPGSMNATAPGVVKIFGTLPLCADAVVVTVFDVRAHRPPRLTDAPLRAPIPLTA